MRARRTLAVGVALLATVAWGASASAAPQVTSHDRPGHQPVLIVHTMSSCGHMDGF